MIEKETIKEIVEQIITGTDLFLVDVIIRPGNTITVEIDRDTEGVSIEDCILLSKKIESQLDRETEDFELEVGSSGITSPLKNPRQYKKNWGKEVEVLTKNGQKHAAILKTSDDCGFVITITRKIKPENAKKKITVEEDLSFNYDEIKYTKYLIRFK